jgi:hypothetical protein
MKACLARRLAQRLISAMILLSLNGTSAFAHWYACDEGYGYGCPRHNVCSGTGEAYASCQVWCYISGGQQLSGYANCTPGA